MYIKFLQNELDKLEEDTEEENLEEKQDADEKHSNEKQQTTPITVNFTAKSNVSIKLNK